MSSLVPHRHLCRPLVLLNPHRLGQLERQYGLAADDGCFAAGRDDRCRTRARPGSGADGGSLASADNGANGRAHTACDPNLFSVFFWLDRA